MKLIDLMTAMDRWDQKGVWVFSLPTLRRMFPHNEERALLKALCTHQAAGAIMRVAKGLYVNPRARSMPSDVLVTLASFLRPWDSSYLSLESVLSDAGWISQIPSRMTFMTTGRSQTFKTPYGTLEFTHTAQKLDKWRHDVVFDEQRRILVATPARAYRDLKRVGRNLDLICVDVNKLVSNSS
jgi:predicted transcriptional regulator of viral defense system